MSNPFGAQDVFSDVFLDLRSDVGGHPRAGGAESDPGDFAGRHELWEAESPSHSAGAEVQAEPVNFEGSPDFFEA